MMVYIQYLLLLIKLCQFLLFFIAHFGNHMYMTFNITILNALTSNQK